MAIVQNSKHSTQSVVGASNPRLTTSGPSTNAFTLLARGTKRALKWARRDHPDYENTSKRGYAVQQMYPRIFYAFSDVIVFVLTNARYELFTSMTSFSLTLENRTLEDVVEKLLNWADSNYARSTNLPTKPHAIIALNKSDHSTPEYQWDPVNATASLLTSTSAQINKNPTFRKYVAKWKHANVHVRDMNDLLRCYYSTVKVVRLPDKSRLQRMHDQRKELDRVIQECCNDTMEVKTERRMLPDVDEFGLYLSLAFDHFSESLDTPFDYVEASLKHRPPPESFADNLKVFVSKVAARKSETDVSQLFDFLAPFVASCLILDSSRKQRIGMTHYLHICFSVPC
jgi:hypothetical protein